MNSNENIFSEENDDLKVEYEIIDIESFEDNEIKKNIKNQIKNVDREIDINNSTLQKYRDEIKSFTKQADALDYTVAVGSGILAGIVDSFFVGSFSLAEGKAWSNHKINDIDFDYKITNIILNSITTRRIDYALVKNLLFDSKNSKTNVATSGVEILATFTSTLVEPLLATVNRTLGEARRVTIPASIIIACLRKISNYEKK